jgi:hypothetical protein
MAVVLGVLGEGRSHGPRVLRVCGKGTKVVLIPLPPSVGRAIDRAVGGWSTGPILLNPPWQKDGPAYSHLPPPTPGPGRQRTHCPDPPGHVAAHLRDHDARRRSGSARRPDRRPACRSAHHRALRACTPEPRPPPDLHPGGLHASGTKPSTDKYRCAEISKSACPRSTHRMARTSRARRGAGSFPRSPCFARWRTRSPCL